MNTLLQLVKEKSYLLRFLVVLLALTGINTTYAAMNIAWMRPQPEKSFNPYSDKGFDQIPFQGIAEDELGENGLLGLFDNGLQAVTVVLTKNDDEVRVDVSPEKVTISQFNTWYRFDVALSEELFAGVDQVDGNWNVQVVFTVPDPQQPDNPDVNAVYATDWDGYIILDTSAPLSLVTPQLDPEEFTGDPVQLSISCEEQNGSGCLEQSYTTYVRGNFCDDEEICNPNAVRGFEVCDLVGNCTDPQENLLTLTRFDNIPPRFTGGIRFGGIGLQEEIEQNTFKAEQGFTVEIKADDRGFANFDDLYDPDACGTHDEENDSFLAQDVILQWETEQEGQQLEGFVVEKSPYIGEPDWSVFGFTLSTGDGTYRFEDTVPGSGEEYLFRLKVGPDGNFSHTSAVSVSTPLPSPVSIGTEPINALVTSFTATEGVQRCAMNEIFCVFSPTDRRPIDQSGGLTCSAAGSGFEQQDYRYGFPYTLPFPLSPVPESVFPLSFPAYLSE